MVTGKKIKWVEFDEGSLSKRAWVNRHKLLFSLDGNIMKQGTYIFDAKTGERKKLTPFIANQIYVFGNTGYVMFSANEKMYKYNTDTKELKEFDKGSARMPIKILEKKR